MIPPLMVVVKHFSTLQGNFFLAFSRSLCYAINERGENNMWLDAIRNMKSKSGLTTAEIAMQSGIPEPTLEKLFAGKVKDPKLPTMQKLVRFFGYTLDDLDDPAPETKKPPHQPKPARGRFHWKNQMHFWSLSDISSPASRSLMMTLRFSGT